jgi:hypothetical protein
MKPAFFRTLLSAAFCIALLSCSDDDKKDSNSNQFTVEGVTIPILESASNVYQQEDSDGNIVYGWHIWLAGETESEVEFTLYHGEGSSLTAGTYSFDSEKSRDAFTFFTVYAATEDKSYEEDVKSGTIKVEKSGETYTVTIDVVVEGDISIKGYYKGALELMPE